MQICVAREKLNRINKIIIEKLGLTGNQFCISEWLTVPQQWNVQEAHVDFITCIDVMELKENITDDELCSFIRDRLITNLITTLNRLENL